MGILDRLFAVCWWLAVAWMASLLFLTVRFIARNADFIHSEPSLLLEGLVPLSLGVAPFAALIIGRWVTKGTWSLGPWARKKVPQIAVSRPFSASQRVSASRSRWLLVGAISGAIPPLKYYFDEDVVFLWKHGYHELLTGMVIELLAGIAAGMVLALVVRRLWFGRLIPYSISGSTAMLRLEKVRLGNVIT